MRFHQNWHHKYDSYLKFNQSGNVNMIDPVGVTQSKILAIRMTICT